MAVKFSYKFHIGTGLVEIGRYDGAPIYLSPAFFIVAAFLAFPFWHMMSLHGLVLAAMFIVVIFASLLIDELAPSINTFLFIGTALAGFPIWAPPEFRANWEAFQAARQGRGTWDAYAS